MNFCSSTADFFVPDLIEPDSALARTTHLAIGAHQDDLEVMAYHGIAQCYDRSDRWFTGVVCSNGAGCARAGMYSSYSNDEMIAARKNEQRKAATLGKYGAIIQLGYASAELKQNPANFRSDLKQIFSRVNPEIVYLHNPLDKHETHLAVLVSVLRELRDLPKKKQPRQVFGCEVWRGLDWVPDSLKVALDVSQFPELARQLIEVFESQIAGGKRYDLAELGRRRANATFSAPRQVDGSNAVSFALDLTPLLESKDNSSFEEQLHDFINRPILELQRMVSEAMRKAV